MSNGWHHSLHTGVTFLLFLSALYTDSRDVMLVGGTSKCIGTLEMKHQGEWRPVDGWSDWNHQSSSVVCRQLGCGSAVSTEQRDGSTNQPAWGIHLDCFGSEFSLKSEFSLRECGLLDSGSYPYSSLYLICSGNKQ